MKKLKKRLQEDADFRRRYYAAFRAIEMEADMLWNTKNSMGPITLEEKESTSRMWVNICNAMGWTYNFPLRIVREEKELE